MDRILKELSKADPRAFMELSYLAIMHDPEYAVNIEHDKQEKIDSLKQLIEFFQSQERYEECAELVKILKEVEKL